MIKRILGLDWTLAREASTSVDISRGLRSDVLQRLFVIVLVITLLSWAGHAQLALLWGAAVVIQESIDPVVAARLRNFDLSPRSRLLPFMLHNFVGCGIWAALGLALWMTNEGASMFLGVALLIGTLVHISVFYSVSRLQIITNASPIVAALAGMVAVAAARGEFPVADKALIGVSVSVLAIYVMIAAWHNVKSNERLRALIRQTERFAAEDSLTRLLNRRAFLEAVDASWKENETICVAFLDLDRFKPINDEFGHAVGDEVLRRIGARLAGSANVACAARLGGDEFAALIIADRSDDELDLIIDRLYSRVTAPIMVDSGELYVGASLGYAVSPRDGELVPDLLHAADTAMRRMKAERGGAARYKHDRDSGSQSLESLETALRKALASGQIRPALQPIVCSRRRQATGFELLARWTDSGFPRDPSPVEFIPVAEKLGLLNELLWVTLKQALPTIRLSDLKLAINISPSQLTSTRFLDRLCDLLFEHGVAPDRIELEITEQVAIRNIEQNAEILAMARARGFSIVMDDFGSGYSSLAMIDALPLDKLKLDRSFLQRPNNGGAANDVLRAAIGLARELGITCCVEGIEDAETADLVTRLGCDQLQGYWIGRPEIPDENGLQIRLAS